MCDVSISNDLFSNISCITTNCIYLPFRSDKKKEVELVLASGVPLSKRIPAVPYGMLTVPAAGSLFSQVSEPEDKHYIAIYASNSTTFEWLQKERGRVEDQ